MGENCWSTATVLLQFSPIWGELCDSSPPMGENCLSTATVLLQFGENCATVLPQWGRTVGVLRQFSYSSPQFGENCATGCIPECNILEIIKI